MADKESRISRLEAARGGMHHLAAYADDTEAELARQRLISDGLARLALLAPGHYAELVRQGRAPAVPPPTNDRVRQPRGLAAPKPADKGTDATENQG